MAELILPFLEEMKNNCVFAGTFDPITIGHAHLIDNCINAYDKVFVVVGENPNKTPFLPIDVRLNAIKETFKDKVTVINYADYKENYRQFLMDNNVTFYVRGIRNDIDMQFEKEYAKKNTILYPEITTVFMKTKEEFKDVSSSLVRDNILNKKEYLHLIPNGAREIIFNYLKNQN